MPSQRPYFLSSFIAAFRQQQNHPLQPTGQQPNKQTSSSTPATGTSSASAPRTISTNTSSSASASGSSSSNSRSQSTGVAIHSPRNSGGPTHSHGIPIPSSGSPGGRRRGSDSSSEGFRDVLGADKWYIGGKTATGEEKFFKLGVVRRVRSNDGLSLDRLSL